MVRKLKYHEKKLLKKVDFINWECDNNIHELKIMNRYGLKNREDYTRYNTLSREIRTFARKIKDLNDEDPLKTWTTAKLLDKLYEMGLISHKTSLEVADKITASSFCRRRIPCIMVKNKMSERVKAASQFVEQGHVRMGVEVILDPAYYVTRSMEDYITWVDNSKIKQHILEYNNMNDDFDGL